MADLGTHFAIDDTLTIPFQTKASSGAYVDADANPLYRIYEEGGTTAIVTGSASKRDDANTTGYYEAVVTLSAANLFDVGKSYTVWKTAIVGGVTVVAVDTFAVSNAGGTSAAAVAGWPTTTDLTTRLTDAGLTAPSTATMQFALNAAVEAFERATEWEPFLNAASTTSTRYFSPRGSSIFAIGGIVAAPTTVTIQQDYSDAGAIQNGTVLVIYRDYVLLPTNALADGLPYQYIKYIVGSQWGEGFRGSLGNRPRSISVLAPFGFCTAVPADAWEAVLQEAQALTYPNQMITASGGGDRIKQGPLEVEFGANGGTFSTATGLQNAFARRVAARYKRLRVA